MATITAVEYVSLDGVMQSPGRPDEDTRDGFERGGWAAPLGEDPEAAGRSMAGSGDATAMLFGHRTYDDLVGHWLSTTEPNPFTAIIRDTPKHVATRDPGADLPHPRSHALVGEASETVAALKRRTEGTIVLLGSGRLLHDLVAAGLVDTFVVTTLPVVLGGGLPLWSGTPVDLEPSDTFVSASGIVVRTLEVRHP